MHRCCYIAVVENVGNELAAAVGLVAGREAAAQNEYVALVDASFHLVDRREYVVRSKVAEYRLAYLGACAAECARRVVVAVGAGEYRNEDLYLVYRLAGIFDGLATAVGRPGSFAAASAVGIYGVESLGVGRQQRVYRHALAVDRKRLVGYRRTEQLGRLEVERAVALDQNRAVREVEQSTFVAYDFGSDAVAERHLGQRFGYAAEADSPCRRDRTLCDLVRDERKVAAQGVGVGHAVGERTVAYKVEFVARTLELGAYDRACVDGRDAEGHERRRYVYVAESAAHRVLAADRGQTQRHLHLQCTQQRRHRLAPRSGRGHALEILLIREAHAVVTRTGGDDLGACLDDGVCRTVVRAPRHQIGVIAECHDAGRIGIGVADGEFLHRHLSLGGLRAAAVRHQHGRGSDRGVEHLDQSLL